MTGYAVERRQPKRNLRWSKQHIERMFTGPLKSNAEVEKCSYLIICVEGRDIVNMTFVIWPLWLWPKEKRKVLWMFESHGSPKANSTVNFKTRQKHHREIHHSIMNSSPRLQFERPRLNDKRLNSLLDLHPKTSYQLNH